MNEEGEEGREGVGYSERVYCLSRGIFLFFSRSVCIIIAPGATTMGGQFLLGRHCICPVGNWMAVAGSGPSFRLDSLVRSIQTLFVPYGINGGEYCLPF